MCTHVLHSPSITLWQSGCYLLPIKISHTRGFLFLLTARRLLTESCLFLAVFPPLFEYIPSSSLLLKRRLVFLSLGGFPPLSLSPTRPSLIQNLSSRLYVPNRIHGLSSSFPYESTCTMLREPHMWRQAKNSTEGRKKGNPRNRVEEMSLKIFCKFLCEFLFRQKEQRVRRL